MKVILAHKFLHMMGGTEVYFQNLADILHEHGHETIPFAVKDNRNPHSKYEQYFPASLDFRDKSVSYKLRHFGRIVSRTLYSFESRKNIGELIRDLNPDIAHLQCIENHISPSIIDELHNQQIPMVQSVNTYKHVCAAYKLYRPESNQICYQCQGGRHYRGLVNRCIKNSLSGSALGMLEMYLHQSLLKIYHKVDRFIVPNQFLADKMKEGGYPEDKIIQIRNPFQVESIEPQYKLGKYFLYFGRIEPEKGVFDLVRAMKRLKDQRLVVVGSGSDRDKCSGWARQNRLDNVEFVGPKWGAELKPYLQECLAVVVPSLWHEPSPYVIYQAMAEGKPVIGNRVGGIPDLITEETGRLATPGDIDDLATQMASVCETPEKALSMGKAGRAWAEAMLSPQYYYQRLMEVYSPLLDAG